MLCSLSLLFSTSEVEVVDKVKNYIIFSSQQALHDGPDHFFL
jgi:hypothetical protein